MLLERRRLVGRVVFWIRRVGIIYLVGLELALVMFWRVVWAVLDELSVLIWMQLRILIVD